MIISRFDKWEQEWAYVEQMLYQDDRNNSAWAQRAFLLQHRLCTRIHALMQTETSSAQGVVASTSMASSIAPGQSEDVAGDGAFLRAALMQDERAFTAASAACGKGEELHQQEHAAASCKACMEGEVAFVKASVQRMPRNESVWNYLGGLAHVMTSVVASCAQELGLQCTAGMQAGSLLSQPTSRGLQRDLPKLALLAKAVLVDGVDSVRCAVGDAESVVAQAWFDVPLAVLPHADDSVPARALLFQAYASQCALSNAGGRQHDQDQAKRAMHALGQGLCVLDPLRKGHYESVMMRA